MEHSTKTFAYFGFHFTPFKQLPNDELDLDMITPNLSSDFNLGLSKYSWGKQPYSHEGFYRACGEKFYDVFRCVENGHFYIPGKNELFQYHEEEGVTL